MHMRALRQRDLARRGRALSRDGRWTGDGPTMARVRMQRPIEDCLCLRASGRAADRHQPSALHERAGRAFRLAEKRCRHKSCDGHPNRQDRRSFL